VELSDLEMGAEERFDPLAVALAPRRGVEELAGDKPLKARKGRRARILWGMKTIRFDVGSL
jgi:hypothetical protein